MEDDAVDHFRDHRASLEPRDLATCPGVEEVAVD
jgi:hypothetical protein